MVRGEVWWVNFEPSIGGEIKKTRPAIIVSNDAAIRVLNRIQVVPTTSKISKCFPWEAYVEVDGKTSKAMADQLTTVSKLRLQKKIGKISKPNILDVERAIKVQLGF